MTRPSQGQGEKEIAMPIERPKWSPKWLPGHQRRRDAAAERSL